MFVSRCGQPQFYFSTRAPYNEGIAQDQTRKYVDRVVMDIRPPHARKIFRRDDAEPRADEGVPPPPEPVKPRVSVFDRAFWNTRRAIAGGVLAAFVLFFTGTGLYLWFSKDSLIASARTIYTNFKDFSDSMAKLDTDGARQSLASVSEELDSLARKVRFLQMVPALNDIPETFDKLEGITDIIAGLMGDVEELKTNGFHLMFSESGEGVLPILRRMDLRLGELEEAAADLRNHIAKFSSFTDLGVDDNYLALSSELLDVRRSLQALIRVLSSEEDLHVLVLLENPSEMRPSGGFSGSYAEITVSHGRIASYEVNDIYYPDHFFDRKIVPPKQLQGVTGSWGARDTNWFFDFPMSARKVSEFMEQSSVYAPKGIEFDAVLTVNVWTIQDLLDIVGPISVPEYGMTLTSENFLSSIQEEVEAGRDKKPGQNPKRVLSVVAPLLLEELSTLEDEDKKEMLETFVFRLNNKDIKAYFEDHELQSFIERQGFAGAVYDLPRSFSGDYLAVVNTNVAGGKTDAFVNEDIALHSTVLSDGTIVDDLVVTRVHRGKSAEESWYRTHNQNYIKIFTHPDAELELVSGNTNKTVNPLVNYKGSSYEIDPDLAAIEDTQVLYREFNASRYKEAGKAVFATWFTINAGEEKDLQMRYMTPGGAKVAPGAVFQFVYDKQSGVEAGLEYTVKAPEGYRWKEVGDDLYSYKAAYVPARFMVTLTLEKI